MTEVIAEVEDVEAVAVAAPREPARPAGGVLDAPTRDFEEGLARRGHNRRALLQWVRGALVEGTDFGKIKGKESLWKPGAEKILGMLNCIAEFPNLNRYEDMALEGKEIRQIILRCSILNAQGEVIANGIGARSLAQDNGDLNKALKMAKKSALIDGCLTAGGLSEIFTQDIEDMPAVNTYNEPIGAEAKRQDGPAASDKQKGFIKKLVKSSVFSEEEREHILSRVDTMSKERASDAIEGIQAQIEDRKAPKAPEGSGGSEGSGGVIGNSGYESYVQIGKDVGLKRGEVDEMMESLWAPTVEFLPHDHENHIDLTLFPEALTKQLDTILRAREEGNF